MLQPLLADGEVSQVITIAVIFLVLIFALFAFVVFARYFRLWIQSVTTGASIGIFDLLGMTFRKVNPAVIVRSKIMAVQAGLGEDTGVTSKALEAHYHGGRTRAAGHSAPSSPPAKPRSSSAINSPPPSTWPAATCWKP